MKEKPPEIKRLQKIQLLVGIAIGTALFGVSYSSYGSPFHVILIPIVAGLCYWIPGLMYFPDD